MRFKKILTISCRDKKSDNMARGLCVFDLNQLKYLLPRSDCITNRRGSNDTANLIVNSAVSAKPRFKLDRYYERFASWVTLNYKRQAPKLALSL